MLLFIAQLIATFFAASIAYYLIFRWKPRYFKKQGINGPFPLPILGNMLDIIKLGVLKTDMNNVKKYGRVWGVFEGASAILQIAEPDMIREVMVKNFNNFVNRKTVKTDNAVVDNFLTNLRDGHWRHVRHLMTPAFSTGKIKLMITDINDCATLFVENVTKLAKEGQTIDVKDICSDFTMDVIARTAFGIEIDTQKHPNSPFVINARKIFNLNFFRPAILIYLMFPIFRPLMRKLKVEMVPEDVLMFFRQTADNVVRGRKSETLQRTDLLQLMINAHKEQESSGEREGNEHDDSTESSDWFKKGLNDDEILSQSIMLLLAGTETTASTLAYLAYCLALNPTCQDKVHEEVISTVGDKVEVDFNTAHNGLKYLEQCIDETLRLYPPALRTDRQVKEDTTICGIPVLKDTYVSVQIYAVHHDPLLWPDPETFNPDRFDATNKAAQHPFQYLPFGLGPRMCIGMRLAQLEIKIAMTHLIRKFRFVISPDTEIPLSFKKKNFLQPLNGIKLKIELR